tara:strand:+ start:61 stop:963 length:903 start_codon:yes stop_codon:yes gene_type:complete
MANPPLRYPLGIIDKRTDFLLFEELKYEKTYSGGNPLIAGDGKSAFRVKRASDNYSSGKVLNSVILPIPGNISDSQAVTYGEDNLNSIAAAAVGLVAKGVQNDSLTKGLTDIISGVVGGAGEILGSSGVGNASSLFFGSMAANVFGANTSFEGLLSRTTGQIINPNLELLFTGVALRSFTFDFNFVPRSGPEGEAVRQIIRMFKKAMSAKSTSGVNNILLSAPNVFRLTYKSGSIDHPFLNKFKVMALDSMSVNYTASGQYATYENGTPVHMQMQLSFKELNPIYAEEYDKGAGLEGVGY